MTIESKMSLVKQVFLLRVFLQRVAKSSGNGFYDALVVERKKRCLRMLNNQKKMMFNSVTDVVHQ